MTFYISGPITGQPSKNRDAFYAAQEKLERDGHTALNPFELESEKALPSIEGYDKNYLAILRECIAELTKCDSILMLPDWELSRGARLEATVAWGLDIPLFYYDDKDNLVELPLDCRVNLTPLILSCYWNE